MSDPVTPEQQILQAAMLRYWQDAEFHARCFQAAIVLETALGWDVVHRERERLRMSAAVAMHLAETPVATSQDRCPVRLTFGLGGEAPRCVKDAGHLDVHQTEIGVVWAEPS